MKNHNQDGATDILLLPLIIASVLLLGALGFGFWAYGQFQDYKNNSDQKVAAAVTVAKQQEGTLKDKQYAEAAKNPLKTYVGPAELGSLTLKYPKTWSAYMALGANSTPTLEGYLNPDTVPSVQAQDSVFALRVSIVGTGYASQLQQFQNSKNATVVPYALPKLPQVVGVKITGQIESNKQGTMIMLPLRDKTLKIYTESSASQADFDNIILPNVTFIP